MLEGFSMARPAIASDLGGIPEIVKHKVNGYLFNPHRLHEGVDAVMKLIGDRQNMIRMGLAGRALAESDYSLAAHASRVLHLYSNALDRGVPQNRP